MNRAVTASLQPGGQAGIMETAKAAQTRNEGAFSELLKAYHTFNADKRTFGGKPIYKVPGGL
jgi:hypothetical protein